MRMVGKFLKGGRMRKFILVLAALFMATLGFVEVALGQIALGFAIVAAIGIGLAIVATTVRSPLLFMTQIGRFFTVATTYAISVLTGIASQFAITMTRYYNKASPTYDITGSRRYGHGTLTDDDQRYGTRRQVGISPRIVLGFWQFLVCQLTRRHDDAITDYGFRMQHRQLTGLTTLGFT